MNRIHTDKIKMRPRIFFIAGSSLGFLGLVLAIVSSAFLISIIKLSLREGGRLANYKLEVLQSMFHWWIPFGALLSIALGVWLLHQYEFSYKKNFLLVSLGFILAVFIAGIILDVTKFNETILKRGPMSEMVKPWHMENGGMGQRSGPRDGTGREFRNPQ
jgi:hypothetical protein